MWKVIFILFLIAHGVIHIADVATRKTHSGLFGGTKALSWALALAAAVVLIVSGAGLWMTADWWRVAALGGMALSMLWMILFFDVQNLPIMAVNTAVIISIAALSWPSVDTLGA